MSERLRQIEKRLRDAFGRDAEIAIKDQSHLHAGHDGARDGRGHFDVRLISTQFEGVSRIRRHQMVYDALGDLMESDIHAVRIKALTPSE